MFNRKCNAVLTTGFALLLIAPGLEAQEPGSGETEAALRAMVAEPSPAEQDRKVIRDFLGRQDVTEVAAERGIDLDLLDHGVATLEADAARSLADRVREMDDRPDLVGGDTFVVSSTVVIIVLLVLILIAVS